jgi:iron complex transport system permease protein
MTRRQTTTLAASCLVLVGACVLRLVVGSGDGPGWPRTHDVWELRLLRLAVGAAVGAALGVAGVFLQCLLRNPIASPDVLGLASGAGLGVTALAYAGTVLGLATIPAPAASSIAALAGAVAALGLVLLLGRRRGRLDPLALILVGIVVGVIASAGTVFLQHLMPDRGLIWSRWLVGSLSDEATWGQTAAAWAGVAGSIALGLFLARSMDASALGDDEARSVGVRMDALRLALFLGAGVLTAASVVLAGPVAFVGLVAPHLVRLGAGPSHRVVVPASACAGAAVVVLSDALVKAVDLGAGRMPLGVITSILGGPLFVWMLRSTRRVW